MLYKLNEIGELLETDYVTTPDGSNGGYIFFETREDAYKHFMQDIYTKIEEQQTIIDALLLESLNNVL